MTRIFAAFFFFFLVAAAATAQEPREKVVAGLSQSRVQITANFDGTGILVFGAVKRQSPPPEAGPLQVVIAVSGPLSPVVVRRKEKRLGIWINTEAIEIDAAPSFYAVSSTAPLAEVLSATEDLRYKISIGRMIRSVGVVDKASDAAAFSEAVMRIRRNNGLYSESGGVVELTDETLFRTHFALPANLTEGDYRTRIFLTRDRKVVDAYDTTITVRKVGLERWIYNLAHERPLVYGLLSLTIAVLAGWIASTVFRLLRLS